MYKILQHGEKTVEHVFSTMFYFMRHNSRDIQSESLNALGFVCVRHYNFMLEYKLKNLYIDILSKEFYPTQHKTQVNTSIDEIISDILYHLRYYIRSYKPNSEYFLIYDYISLGSFEH